MHFLTGVEQSAQPPRRRYTVHRKLRNLHSSLPHSLPGIDSNIVITILSEDSRMMNSKIADKNFFFVATKIEVTKKIKSEFNQ